MMQILARCCAQHACPPPVQPHGGHKILFALILIPPGRLILLQAEAGRKHTGSGIHLRAGCETASAAGCRAASVR